MEWNRETVRSLSQHFLDTLSPFPIPRQAAESFLGLASEHPNYGLTVLRLVAEPGVGDHIRHAAAVNFKNHLRRCWSPRVPADPRVQAPEKDQIKSLIVPLMLSASPRVRSQLSEALAVIADHDFPGSWPNLLPDLVSGLREASDYSSVAGFFRTANSVFKKFRYQQHEHDDDLKYCLDNFAAPLSDIFLKTARLIEEEEDAETLRPLFECQRLCCRIFYSLNSQEFSFKGHAAAEWVNEFHKYLTTSYPAPLEEYADELRLAVLENIILYMEKNEEEFQGYLPMFAPAVWTFLGDSSSSSHDRLTVTGMKFLTAVSTSVHHSLFARDGVIQHIYQTIVIPNVRLREEDEELFEMDFVEFMRRDMEGSDLGTRRRAASDLLKGIATHNKALVTGILSVQIDDSLFLSSRDPVTRWKDRDSAIYLAVSLAAGSSETDLIDVISFFSMIIHYELKTPDANRFPTIKAGALKFVTTFQNRMPKKLAWLLLRHVTQFLGSRSNVVHSYAAIYIENLLLLEDEGGRARYTSADIGRYVFILLNNLFDALRDRVSEEDQYVIKCAVRVLEVVDISQEVAEISIEALTSVLNQVCQNPKNPVFHHLLFESVAVLIRRADASLIPAFEPSLFPALLTILADDITEFLPYAFQLLAQVVELNRPPTRALYMPFFQILLLPHLWNRSSNVPALVRLLRAFLQKAPDELNRGSLGFVLDIILDRLVTAAPSTEEQGFYVLNTVIESLHHDVVAPFVGGIWGALFTCLLNKPTVKFVKSLLIFMSIYLVKHGWTNLVDSMNAVQAGVFVSILEEIWIPYLRQITGAIELKLTAVASTKLLCECPVLLAAQHRGKLLDSIVTLLSRPEEEPDIAEEVGYAATFVLVNNAGKKEEDPLEDIKDPREFLVASLAGLCARSPGGFPRIIGETLDAANQAALVQFCNSYMYYE